MLLLTDAVADARRGSADGLSRLVALWHEVDVVLPLSEPLIGKIVRVHLAPGRGGKPFMPIFTDGRILRRTAEHYGWRTDGDSIERVQVSAVVTLRMALAFVRSGTAEGAVINPGDPSALDLHPDEIEGILAKDPRPLIERLSRLPIPEDKRFFAGPSPTEPGGRHADAS